MTSAINTAVRVARTGVTKCVDDFTFVPAENGVRILSSTGALVAHVEQIGRFLDIPRGIVHVDLAHCEACFDKVRGLLADLTNGAYTIDRDSRGVVRLNEVREPVFWYADADAQYADAQYADADAQTRMQSALACAGLGSLLE